MNYRKPYLGEVGNSVEVIQQTRKTSTLPDNVCPTDNNATTNAYEADE